jgi:uncharacterized repeat protein (TIGR03843 family)
MDTPAILSILTTGDIEVEGQFLWGSNYTLLVNVSCGGESLKAVYKPTRGVRELWDFDSASLARREVAAWLISEALGWALVPPTVFRENAPLGDGSLQFFVEHEPDYHFFNFTPEDRQRLKPAAAFDVLINNADRKGGHFIVDGDRHIWLIDHGICFHEDPKLRTVLWDFGGEAIPAEVCAALGDFRAQLQPGSELSLSLEKYLSPRELAALARRADRLLARGEYPLPPRHTRPYPWPLV